MLKQTAEKSKEKTESEKLEEKVAEMSESLDRDYVASTNLNEIAIEGLKDIIQGTDNFDRYLKDVDAVFEED